jgi:hypothetical protein
LYTEFFAAVGIRDNPPFLTPPPEIEGDSTVDDSSEPAQDRHAGWATV